MSNSIAFELNMSGQPDVTWTADMDMPEGIQKVAEYFNNHPTEQLLASSMSCSPAVQDGTTGIEYMMVRKPGDSASDYVLAIAPTGSGVDQARRLRASFFYHTLGACNVYDAQGDRLPVVMMGAPSRTSTVVLGDTARERAQVREEIRHGNFDPLAERYVELGRRILPEAGRVHLTGFSYGGTVALAGASVAPKLSLDVPAVAAGDPTNNTADRGLWQLVTKDFGREASLLKPAMEKAGVRAFIDVLEAGSSLGFVADVAAKGTRKLNYAIVKGETTDTYRDSIDAILSNSQNTAVTLGVGGDNDHVATRARFTEHAGTARILHGLDRLHIVEVEDGSHSWGDNILLHSAFLAYAIARSS